MSKSNSAKPSQVRAAAPKGRQERLDIRASHYAKTIIKRAADRKGLSMAEFIMQTVLPEAEKITAEESRLLLSSGDFDRFYDELDRPPRLLANIRKLAAKKSPFAGVRG